MILCDMSHSLLDNNPACERLMLWITPRWWVIIRKLARTAPNATWRVNLVPSQMFVAAIRCHCIGPEWNSFPP